METDAAVLGSTFDPFGAHLEDPYPVLATARAECPVFYSERLFGWVVTRYDDVMAILRDPATFSSRNTIDEPFTPCAEALGIYRGGYPAAPHEINTDPPAHTRFRRALRGVFNRRAFAAMEPTVAMLAEELVARFEGSAQRDVLAEISLPLSFTVILSIFGVPREDHEQLHGWFRQMLRPMSPETPVADQVGRAQATVACQHYLADLIEARRELPADDMISHLVHHTADGDEPFSRAELVEMCRGLIIAGHETTSNLIANATVLLLEERSRWRRVADDRSLLPGAIEEVLRYESPLPFFRRLTTRDVDVAGVRIEEGATVLLGLGSANRDESRFPAPAVFDIERSDNPHLAFGNGLHFCTGAPLARMEARVVLGLLADRFPRIELSDRPRAHVPGFQRRWNRVCVDV